MSLHQKEAVVQYEPTLTSPEAVAEKVDDMGFPAHVKSTPYKDGVILVEGMTCMSCVRNIEGNIITKQGVKFIKVSLDHKLAYVKFDPEQSSLEQIRDAIDDMGFEARLSGDTAGASNDTTRISVEGMTCQSCVKTIEGNISTKPGVIALKVSLTHNEAVIQYDPKQTNPETLRDQIDDMGFDATLPASPAVGSVCVVGIEGMTCHSCVANIEGVIGDMEGVHSMRVSLQDKIGIADFDSSKTSAEAITDRVDDMGFESKLLVGGSSGAPSVTLSVADLNQLANQPSDEVCHIDVEGMTCNSCVQTIEQNLRKVDGIVAAIVSLSTKSATVTFTPSKLSPPKIAECIDDMGFDAKVSTEASPTSSEASSTFGSSTKVSLGIRGMTCQSCVRKIEGTMSEHAGVLSVKVTLASQRGDFTIDPRKINTQQLIQAVTALGFTASLPNGRCIFFVYFISSISKAWRKTAAVLCQPIDLFFSHNHLQAELFWKNKKCIYM